MDGPYNGNIFLKIYFVALAILISISELHSADRLKMIRDPDGGRQWITRISSLVAGDLPWLTTSFAPAGSGASIVADSDTLKGLNSIYNATHTWVTQTFSSISLTGSISASTYTVRGIPIISSTWSVVGYEGFSLKVTSGNIAANGTVTITAIQLGWALIGIPVCVELEGVNTAVTSVRLKDTVSSTSFQVYNADAINAKKFACFAVGRP